MFGLGKLVCSEISVNVPWTRLKYEPITAKLGHVQVLITEQDLYETLNDMDERLDDTNSRLRSENDSTQNSKASNNE